MKDKGEKLHQKAYHHVKKQKKKYYRFVLFFLFILIFRIIEDYFLLRSAVVEFEFDIIVLLIVLISAVIFTAISEITELFIEEDEAKKLLKYIRKRESKFEHVMKKKSKR
jgi:membrane protein YqaA with SNARE-associated domain